MATLEAQKKIVPQEIILNGNADDVFFLLKKEDGTKILEVTGDGKVAFFGKAAVGQAAAASGTEVAEATWSADEVNMLNTAYNALKNLGIIA